MPKQQHPIGYGAIEVMQIEASKYRIRQICEETLEEIKFWDKKIEESLKTNNG